MGLYNTPERRMGELSYQMWRASRLVVDTGIHAFNWDKARAIAFMRENTALTDANIEAEVNRYISWPGQALGYMIGRLKILELRQRAERALGDRFDVRRFHDAVLRNGSVPLDVLEAEIDRGSPPRGSADEMSLRRAADPARRRWRAAPPGRGPAAMRWPVQSVLAQRGAAGAALLPLPARRPRGAADRHPCCGSGSLPDGSLTGFRKWSRRMGVTPDQPHLCPSRWPPPRSTRSSAARRCGCRPSVYSSSARWRST